MIAFQQRAKTSINKVFSFNECHPRCSCNKDLCMNYLIASSNKKQFKLCIKRIYKTLSPIYQHCSDMSPSNNKQDLNGVKNNDNVSSPNSNQISSGGVMS